MIITVPAAALCQGKTSDAHGNAQIRLQERGSSTRQKKGASVSLGTQKHSPYVLSQQAMKTSRFSLPYPAQTGKGNF